MGCGCCPKCAKCCSIGFLVIAIILLGVDLGWWTFFGIQWYTLLILWFAVGKVGAMHCKECQACSMPEKGKKKK